LGFFRFVPARPPFGPSEKKSGENGPEDTTEKQKHKNKEKKSSFF
jgi:hypothetical protein